MKPEYFDPDPASIEKLANEIERMEAPIQLDLEPSLPLGDVFTQAQIDDINASGVRVASFGRRRVSAAFLVDPKSIGLSPEENEFIGLFEESE